jgi:hypothetical protein
MSTSQRGIPLIAEARSDRGRRDGFRAALGAGAAAAVGGSGVASCPADDGVSAAPLAGPAAGRVPELDAADAVAVTVVPVPPPDPVPRPDEDEPAVGLAGGAALLLAVAGGAALDAGAGAEPPAVGVAPPADAAGPLEEPVPVAPEEPLPEEPVPAVGAAAVAGAGVRAAAGAAAALAAAVGPVADGPVADGPVAAWEAATVTPGAGSVTELTMDPSVLVTGPVTEFTTPETVAGTPENRGGWLLVAARACTVGTARRNAVPPVAIANPAAWRTVRRVFGFDIDNSSHRETRACRTEALPWGTLETSGQPSGRRGQDTLFGDHRTVCTSHGQGTWVYDQYTRGRGSAGR